MPNLEDMQKELQQMGESVRRMQDSVAELAREQAQAREARAGEAREAVFAAAERKGAAYPLVGHVMEKADQKDKEAYLSLLLFTWSLLAPEAEEGEAGLVTAARIWESLQVAAPLYMLFCHMKEKSDADLGTWLQILRISGGTSAYLLDTLVLCQEMKAEKDAAFEKLSRMYMLLGCQEAMLREAIEASRFIHERDRGSYLQHENHRWQSFDGKAGECYLNLVGSLNIPGPVAPTSYYALWPERKEGETGISKYPPAVMLKIQASEGAMVEKGQILFTVYGSKKEMSGDLVDWNGAIDVLMRNPEEYLIRGYDSFSVKAEMDGTLHWKPEPDAFAQREFNVADEAFSMLIGKVSLGGLFAPKSDQEKDFPFGLPVIRRKGEPHRKWQKGDFFLSDPSLTPNTIGQKPICVIEKK